MAEPQSLDIRKAKLETKVKWGLGLLGVVLVAPLTGAILWGLVGVAALAVAGVVGGVSIFMAPAVGMKVANWRMKMVTSEAEENPIETMQNIDIEKTRELEQKDQYLEDWETEVNNFDDEVVSVKKDYPEEAKKYEDMALVMHQSLEEAKREQEQSRTDLFEFEKAIKKAKTLYKLALAAQKVEAFNKRDEAKVLQDIKTQVAFDSVRSNLNRSFARLNNAMSKRSVPALAAPSALPSRDMRGN